MFLFQKSLSLRNKDAVDYFFDRLNTRKNEDDVSSDVINDVYVLEDKDSAY